MQKFLPVQYLQIAIANHFGLDKKTWKERLDWFIDNVTDLTYHIEKYAVKASEPMMFRKMVNQFDNAMNDLKVDGLVSLDATASGVQILGALTACRKTCQRTNLINDGVRHDLYGEASEYMNTFGLSTTRSDLKQPTMTKNTWSLQQ